MQNKGLYKFPDTLEMLDFLDLGVLGVLNVFGSFGRKSAISGGGKGRCC